MASGRKRTSWESVPERAPVTVWISKVSRGLMPKLRTKNRTAIGSLPGSMWMWCFFVTSTGRASPSTSSAR